MARKRAGALLVDVGSYLTGRHPLADYAGFDDRWLHPIDCSWMLRDADEHFGPFDSGGLPMQELSGIGAVYVPSRTAAFGFAHWNEQRLHRNGRDRHIEAFLAAANWFAGFSDGRIWHDFPLLTLSAPWLSGLAQGEALSIFARAYLLTDDAVWRDRSDVAARWLAEPVEMGGVLGRLPDGSPFLEEYPGTRHANVLNGCLYALAGLKDALDIGAAEIGLVERIADSVEANLGAWNRGGWSLYEWAAPDETVANFNTPSYQRVHIALLAHLGATLKREAFLREAEALQQGLARPTLRIRALANKLRYRSSHGW